MVFIGVTSLVLPWFTYFQIWSGYGKSIRLLCLQSFFLPVELKSTCAAWDCMLHSKGVPIGNTQYL